MVRRKSVLEGWGLLRTAADARPSRSPKPVSSRAPPARRGLVDPPRGPTALGTEKGGAEAVSVEVAAAAGAPGATPASVGRRGHPLASPPGIGRPRIPQPRRSGARAPRKFVPRRPRWPLKGSSLLPPAVSGMARLGASPYVWGWLVLLSCLLAGAQLDSDGIVTIEEQIVLVMKAKMQCEQNITAQLQEGEGNCFPEWDGLICWPRGAAGKILAVPCPAYIYDFNHKGVAFRHCTLNGTWDFIQSSNKTWANYSDCFLQPDISIGKQEFFESLYILYTIGYSISFGSLAVAILIIGYFRRLHCTRNYIHLHLFVSFMMRAISIFVKDKVAHAHLRIGELQSLMLNDLQNSIGVPSVDKSQYIGCKIAVVLFIYFLATNYYWILVEGLYLHNLIFVSFFSDSKYLWGFICIGWGFPAAFVVAWAVARATLADTRCWELSAGDKWIYQAPILAAIGLNFVLFLNTVRVLATKIWETNAVGHDMRKQYRKLSKSTLVLVLVFGVHYIVFICQPHSFTGLWWEIRMHCELFFNSFQGFFVSIVYCYCNGEVQAEVKKMWNRWNLSIDWQRPPPCGNHRYGSVLTTVTHSTSSQSQMAASTRMVLISGKPAKTANRLPDCHVTLPGYVWSNSEQDCLPHSIHEETKEGSRRKGDAIPVEGSSRPLEFTLDTERCKGETEDVI
ncbi:parathyroid hormone 2 receptor [Heterocephalus glaber]|uniref:Parathyroid hormone 2 receptor n=1 Tax=Heterocephalus glaber TaxID=10181 RepID=A0AAX6PHP4_HETGA|nr:parathyroid hormone 2 receptor [Heterocephalus glaber]